MNARDLTALVHLVGFTTGILLYGMLGVMTRRRLAYVEAPHSPSLGDRVPLAAAILGVVWNAGAMFVFAVRDFDIAYPDTWVAAIAYTALGFLPAAVVHSMLERSRPRVHRLLLSVAYASSAVAGGLHIIDATRGVTPSSAGLLLLTITYAVLLAVMAVTERKRPGFQRTIAAVALAAFAVTALHLSRHAVAPDSDSWPMELIGHHASLPLVLALLYQDYRFAFADLFLKRALSLLALVGLMTLLYATVAAPVIDPHAPAAYQFPNGSSHLFHTAALLGVWLFTAVSYPLIQRYVSRFVDRIVLRRADYRELRTELARRLGFAHDPGEALEVTCTLLARALGAAATRWSPRSSKRQTGAPTIALDSRRGQTRIVVPTAMEPSFEIVMSELTGGRVLLSDDLVMIDAVAGLVGRRIDELRLEQERIAREQREAEMRQLATEAELRALRAQLNPHFLFNALNTLGYLMHAAPDRALATLHQLTGLLRAVLRKTNGQFVALREELEIVESYLAIEHERFQERLHVRIDVPDELRHARVPPLLLQPLVENAVKHGIAPMRAGGSVIVRVRRDAGATDADGFLRLTVADTGAGASTSPTTRSGLGLANIERRLQHYFGIEAAMTIRPTDGGGTTVELVVPWITSESAAVVGST